MKFKIDYHIQSIYKLDLTFLKKSHIKNLVIDLDQTLDSPFSVLPSSDAFKLKDELNKLDIKMYVISNNRLKRVKPYCDKLKVTYLSRAKKTKKKRILQFLAKNDINIKETLFVGDQLLTDGIYTKKINGLFLLVEPLTDVDNIFTKINRKIDIIIRRKLRKRNLLGIELGGK